MISTEFKTAYEQSSKGWPPDAKAFCLSMLSAMEDLESRVKTLEDKLVVNSSNGSKPPSKDDFKASKIKSLRKKSGKQPSGQFGHKGRGAELRGNPDEIIPCQVVECLGCKTDLQDKALTLSKSSSIYSPEGTLLT